MSGMTVAVAGIDFQHQEATALWIGTLWASSAVQAVSLDDSLKRFRWFWFWFRFLKDGFSASSFQF